MAAGPRITPEENARIARRERIVSRSIIAVIIAVFLGMFLWPSGGSEDDVGPVPQDFQDVQCVVSYCP